MCGSKCRKLNHFTISDQREPTQNINYSVDNVKVFLQKKKKGLDCWKNDLIFKVLFTNDSSVTYFSGISKKKFKLV